MESQPVLEAKNLTRVYASGQEQLTVLDDVSFKVALRETWSIIGPSGSGKSTLLALCAGLDTPSRGSVAIGGVTLHDLSENQRALLRNEQIGFVFQNFQLLPNLTAIENVTIPLELRNGAAPTKEAKDLLTRVGLKDRFHHYPGQLSGGEQQRVALARAFITKPRLLLADEPTGNLDAETSARIIDLLFEMNTEGQTALVLVTHDPDLARRTNHIMRLRGGRVVQN